MQYTFLGRSGFQVSRIGLGTATFGMAPLEKDVARLIHNAMDLGINYIDGSDDYGNRPGWDRPGAPPWQERKSAEQLIGAALKGRRHEVIIVTKVTPRYGQPIVDGKPDATGLDRINIMRMVERSLRDLQTDYIDIYNAHHHDFRTDLGHTLRAFDDLVQQGKIRYYTLGSYPAWHFVETVMTADKFNMDRPVAHQVSYTITNRSVEREVIPAAQHFGIDLTTFAPLGGGYLAGLAPTKRDFAGRQRYGGAQVAAFTPAQLTVAERMESLGKEWGHPPAQLAIAWVMSRPTVANVVIGAETVTELEQNAGAADLALEQSQLEALSAIEEVPAAFPRRRQ